MEHEHAAYESRDAVGSACDAKRSKMKNEHRLYSPSATIVESSRLVPWMLFACILSGVGMGLSVVTLYNQSTAYRELEREVRLQQLKVDEFRMALITAGIDPNPHVNGESK